MSWRRRTERALSIDQERKAEIECRALVDQVRDALWHSTNEKELKQRLQAILDGSRSIGE